MSTRLALCAVPVAAALLAGCHASEAGTVHTPGNIPPAGSSYVTGAPATPSSAAQLIYTIPNEVGQTLQAAKTALTSMTANPGFPVNWTDGSGHGRSVADPAQWKVCTQSVPAGGQFTSATTVTFTAVPQAETCPTP